MPPQRAGPSHDIHSPTEQPDLLSSSDETVSSAASRFVKLTVKTNRDSIFLGNMARSEHDAKGRKDYLVLHTSDFLERGQLPGHTVCFDVFKCESIKSHLYFTVQGSPSSLFGDSMVMCRAGEEPTCPSRAGWWVRVLTMSVAVNKHLSSLFTACMAVSSLGLKHRGRSDPPRFYPVLVERLS